MDIDGLINHGVPRSGAELGYDRVSVRKLADNLDEQSRPPLVQAYDKVVGLGVDGLAPTAFTLTLFAAYTEAEGYLTQRLRRRAEHLAEAVDRLHEARHNWKLAEEASTLRPETWSRE